MSRVLSSKSGRLALAVAFSAIAIPAAVSAQTLGSPVITSGNLPAIDRVAGVGVGDGVNQSQPVVLAGGGKGKPLVGVGALSGQPTHNGSVATVSVLNSERLLGVSTGPVGSNGVNVANSTGKPVLNGVANAPR